MTTKAQLYLNELGDQREFAEKLAAKDAEIARLREALNDILSTGALQQCGCADCIASSSAAYAALKGKGEGK